MFGIKKREAVRAGDIMPITEPKAIMVMAGPPVKKGGKIVVYKDHSGFWRWTLKSRNGQIIADSSESYKVRSGALRAAKRIKLYAAMAEIKEV